MAYKDPEKARERKRKWYEKNREAVLARGREYGRKYYQEHKEQIRERNREWQQANPEKMREYGRRYAQANPEKELERKNRNREANKESQRRYRERRGTDGRRIQHWSLNHGLRPEDWAAMWDAQDGLCYLCGDGLDAAQTHIDHDHRCCPRDHSCAFCRRGLACGRCNQLIGLAGDDPDKLQRITDSLRAVLPVVEARLAAKPVQEALEFG